MKRLVILLYIVLIQTVCLGQEEHGTLGAWKWTGKPVDKEVVLKDVIVKAPDIIQKSDTLVYSMSKWAQKQDRNMADVLRRLPGVEVAEDVVQDIFLRVADSDIPPMNDNYLQTAVRNACLNRIRQLQLHDKVKGLMPIEDESDLQPIDKRLERLDDIAAYVDEQLEEPHRSIFHLRFEEDLTVSEIARRLGLNPNTAYKYLMQSIQQIRHHFEKH